MCINLFIPGIWLPWRATKGQYITSGRKFKNAKADNLQRCMTRCLRDPTGGNECRSITISTSSNPSCVLRNKRPGDNDFASNVTQHWQSFSRPAWYLGKHKKLFAKNI